MTVSADLISNPSYDRWYDQDQQALSGLLSSMSEEILTMWWMLPRPRRRGTRCSGCLLHLLLLAQLRFVWSLRRP
jgi:hypothetical protein